MRTRKSRMPELRDDQLTPEQAEYGGPARARGVKSGLISAMLRNVQASKAFRGWAQYTMGGQTKLKDREREIVAMRTIWHVKAGYIWARHIPFGRDAGLSAEEMEAFKRPLSERDWAPADLALLRTADALVDDYFIPDDLWADLNAHFTEEQIIDAIFVSGHFVMLAMFINSSGVPVDSDVVADPDLEKIADD